MCIQVCIHDSSFSTAFAKHTHHIHTHTHTHTHIPTHIHAQTNMHTYTYGKGLGKRAHDLRKHTYTRIHAHKHNYTRTHTHTHTHTWRKMRIISSSPCSRSNTLKHTATHCNTLQTHSKTHTSRRGKFSTTLSPSGRIRQVQNTTSYHKYRTRQVVTSTEHDKLSQVL